MSLFHTSAALALAASAAALPVSARAQIFTFQDNSIVYRYSPFFKEPNICNLRNPNGTSISKNIVTLTHVDI